MHQRPEDQQRLLPLRDVDGLPGERHDAVHLLRQVSPTQNRVLQDPSIGEIPYIP